VKRGRRSSPWLRPFNVPYRCCWWQTQAANVLTVLEYVGSQKFHVARKKAMGAGIEGTREGIAPPIEAIDSRSGKIRGWWRVKLPEATSDNISLVKGRALRAQERRVEEVEEILKVRHDGRTYLIRTACKANLRALVPTSGYTQLSTAIESSNLSLSWLVDVPSLSPSPPSSRYPLSGKFEDKKKKVSDHGQSLVISSQLDNSLELRSDICTIKSATLIDRLLQNGIAFEKEI